MNKKTSILLAAVFIILYGLPAYATGYEGVSLFKIIFQLIFYIVVFILVVFFSLYGTKLIAKNFKGITSSKYISLLDVMNIPGGSKIIVTKINNKVYILSSSNSNTSIIDIIDEDDFPINDENFDNYLSKYLNKSHNEWKSNASLLNIFNIKKDKEGKSDEEKY